MGASGSKAVASENSGSVFPWALGGVLVFEAVLLAALRVPVSAPPPPPPPAFKVALAPPPPPPKPKPPAPKPKAKPRMVHKAVVPRPVTPPVLPTQTAESTNLLAASAGTAVNMSWGEGTPSSGGGAGYLPPRLLTKVDTDALYTEKMKADDEEGDVVIDLWIDASGKIVRSKMVVPSVWDDMNKIAENVLRNLKFKPASQNGQAIPGKFELNFRFRIRNTG